MFKKVCSTGCLLLKEPQALHELGEARSQKIFGVGVNSDHQINAYSDLVPTGT